jgi:hypothetical protein
MTRWLVVPVIVLCMLAGCREAAIEAPGPLEGSWKIVEIRVVSQRGEYTDPEPEPGLFIFGKEHYSMIWMPFGEPLLDFAEIWRPTDEEKLTSWNSIVVNTGTYTYTDSTVTTYPLVAKTPEFVGGFAVYDYRVVADTLWMEMTDCMSSGDVQDPGIGVYTMPLKLIRAE